MQIGAFLTLGTIVLPVLLAISLFTLLERKVFGFMQGRRGPVMVGKGGILQPIADGIKLLTKEAVYPSASKTIPFYLAPVFSLSLALAIYLYTPISYSNTHIYSSINLIIIFVVSSLVSYLILAAGYASSSTYSLLGSIRATSQMISYEVSLGLICLTPVLIGTSLSLSGLYSYQLVIYNLFAMWGSYALFFTSILAEANRTPFDLVEGESELVSGYNVEYSGLLFTFFFLTEYSFILIMCIITVALFFGGESYVLLVSIKVLAFIILFIYVRATYPRFRFDGLILLLYKVYLPLAIVWVTLTIVFITHGLI
uniref:NADH-ubiquinone oxidoreductase chain 1 n=1 Tax=Clathrina clathrus TaxID=1031547 RepID=L0HNS4_CLACL|nr:NADH dehydrogenase subunit 1 [Clathrina clathrus]AGB07379.1 NADH dehydrogenase subunit 1 [Clathrina clathrus]